MGRRNEENGENDIGLRETGGQESGLGQRDAMEQESGLGQRNTTEQESGSGQRNTMEQESGSGRKGLAGQLLVSALIVLSLVFLDQITKIYAARELPGNPAAVIPGVFELHYIENHGAAFSILPNAKWLFILITAVILAVIVVLQLKVSTDARGMRFRVLTAILMAGAVGNLIDRVSYGYVRDFLYFRLIDFPVFNVADICVTVSAFLLILWILFDVPERDARKNA